IPDSLQISYTRSLTSQPVPEGAELTLTCSSSIQSEQLTHLSITFGKRGGGERSDSETGGEVSTIREIISIDKLLGVVPGPFYKKRYDDGEITLEKRNGEGGQGLFVMKMKAVQPSDAGSFFCEASQWIRDPDRTWQRIAQRTLDIGNLTIQQLEEFLLLNVLQIFLSVPSGVSGCSILTEGRGVYRCVVSVYAGRKNPSPSTPATLTQRSEGVAVNLKTKDVLVSAVARLSRGPLLKRGSTITLICNTTVTTTGPVQVQVQWLRWPIPEPVITRNSGGVPLDLEAVTQPKPIATLMYNGVANINHSEISIDRLSANSYRLRIHMATEEDQGLYGCHAEVWGQDPHGGWYDTGARSVSNLVTVYLYARGKSLILS
ncbi:hypothetical protein GOODEAATRI_009191, partial [Goodea atripinnis]